MNTFCTISEKALSKQLVIDSIPTLMVLVMLILVSAFCVWGLYKKRHSYKFHLMFSTTCLVLGALWYTMSLKLTDVASNLFNPEYAVIAKFIEGCPRSVEPVAEKPVIDRSKKS